MEKVWIKKGREKSVLKNHLWIFSGAINKVSGNPPKGSPVKIFSHNDEFLGVGTINTDSQVTVRILSRKDVVPDYNFFESKILDSYKIRQPFFSEETDCYRIFNTEGDGISGLIIDKYDDIMVIQCLNAGVEYYKKEIIDSLENLFNPSIIIERSEVRDRVEGAGIKKIWKQEKEIKNSLLKENNLYFLFDPVNGHKTGWYIDQRENRKTIRKISKGKNVLDCFCYTGGFGINALEGEATSVTFVDDSKEAIKTAISNCELNKKNLKNAEFLCENVFEYLRNETEKFDIIILDPPAFAPKRVTQLKAEKGYKEINTQAMKLLKDGGILVSFSCSPHITSENFQKILFKASCNAKRDFRIISKTSHQFDHPINIYVPETEYLKGIMGIIN